MKRRGKNRGTESFTKHFLARRLGLTTRIRSSICLAVDFGISPARQHFSGHAASDKYFCQAAYLSSLQPLSICRHRWRPALTRMTEAPLHTPSTSSSPFPFINLSSACLPLPPAPRHLVHSRSAARPVSLANPSPRPLLHLIFSNLLRFHHLAASPPSHSLLGILQSHSQACEVKDLCNLFSPYSLPVSHLPASCLSPCPFLSLPCC